MAQQLALRTDVDQWRLFELRRQDKGFQAFANKVVERDQGVCHYCSFQSEKHNEVINVDGNYRNNTLDNMALACPFCIQCCFLEMVGVSLGDGVLIYLPELGQADLNGLAHALFAAICNQTEQADTARKLYDHLKLRARLVTEHLGEGMKKPSMLAQMILDTPSEDPKQVEKTILEPLRLLPSLSHFMPKVESWSQEAFAQLQPIDDMLDYFSQEA